MTSSKKKLESKKSPILIISSGNLKKERKPSDFPAIFFWPDLVLKAVSSEQNVPLYKFSFLEDPGKAGGCSKNTGWIQVIDQLFNTFPPLGKLVCTRLDQTRIRSRQNYIVSLQK